MNIKVTKTPAKNAFTAKIAFKENKDHPTLSDDFKGVFQVNVGKSKSFTAKKARELGGKIGKKAKSMKAKEINVELPKEAEKFLQEIVEGLISGQYDIGKLKTTAKKDRYELKKLNFVSSNSKLGEAAKRGQVMAEATEMVKDLVNNPANYVDAAYMSKVAKKIAKDNGYKVKILGDKELKKQKWGGLLSVNQGAAKEARCAILEYSGGKKGEKPVALVGKGMIFDAGGYNLKPTRHIETMQQDMAGGATVLGVMSVLKKLKVKKNVIAIVPMAENMVNEKAYKPSDIITMLSGNTVEITNTDAEGRLILSDGIHYANTQKAKEIITIATLTGAVAVALGDRYCGLMGNTPSMRKKLRKAGSQVDDLAWSLPIHKEYKAKMDSKVADFTNYDMASGRLAGSAKAAAFLEKFVKKTPWTHIDIGGTAFTTDPKPYQTRGATAHGLQMLVRYLQD